MDIRQTMQPRKKVSKVPAQAPPPARATFVAVPISQPLPPPLDEEMDLDADDYVGSDDEDADEYGQDDDLEGDYASADEDDDKEVIHKTERVG